MAINVSPLDNWLSHLICQPYQGRLNNATKFKTLDEETQRSLEIEFDQNACWYIPVCGTTIKNKEQSFRKYVQ